MRRQIPLAAKLGVSFVLVIVLAVALVYALILWSIPQQFDNYRQMAREQFGEQLAKLLAAYRSNEGTWQGVIERILSVPFAVPLGDTSIEGRVSTFDVAVTLFDADGRMISSNAYNWVNAQPREEDGSIHLNLDDPPSEYAIPILVDGRVQGTLYVADVGTPGPKEAIFLDTVTRSALIGGGAAIAVALLLSMMLIVQILRPLRALSRATKRVTGGDMPDRVSLRTHDELGRLGDSFNQMLDSLKRSEMVRQTMTADIAHELRTPVTIIQGTLEAILDGIYDASDASIAPIYEETLHLGRLIDDLRDLALAEAGELHLEKEPIDVGELIRQVAETAFLSREDAPALQLDIPTGLPKASLDPKRFRQVIANLLSNAIRHTPTSGEVSIRVRQRSDQIEVRVSDTGSGIDPNDLPHLFERFYRADPARGRSAGSGLGLAIVKQWVEAHEGGIEAGHRPGGGAQFTIRLPLN